MRPVLARSVAVRFAEPISEPPPRKRTSVEWRACIAEAVKIALVKDAGLFEWIERAANRLVAAEPNAVSLLVRRSAVCHLGHPLGSDFGHWVAERLEVLTQHRVFHGEAVAIGMAIDALYSEAVGLLSPDDSVRILAVLRSLGFSLWDDALRASDDQERRLVLSGLAERRAAGKLTIPLLSEIGRGRDVQRMDKREILAAIDFLEAYR